MKKKILGIFLLVVLVLSLVPLTAVASDGYNLIATGVQGTEDRITVELPVGTTLGQLQSISWEEWLVAGYPPHVDIRLDINENGVYDSGVDDVLVIEYAYNGHEGEPQLTPPTAYSAITGAWLPTFSNGIEGLEAVDDTAIAWLGSGPSGGPDIIVGTIAEWKAGGVAGDTRGVSGSTEVLYLEIEVDNWIIDTTAMIKDIFVDFGSAEATLSTVVTATPPTVVSVVLDLGNIDFGTVYQGSSVTETIRVTNGGNVAIDVVASISVDATPPFNSVTMDPSLFSIPVDGYVDVELTLTIPSDFALGTYTSSGALIFTATEQLP